MPLCQVVLRAPRFAGASAGDDKVRGGAHVAGTDLLLRKRAALQVAPVSRLKGVCSRVVGSVPPAVLVQAQRDGAHLGVGTGGGAHELCAKHASLVVAALHKAAGRVLVLQLWARQRGAGKVGLRCGCRLGRDDVRHGIAGRGPGHAAGGSRERGRWRPAGAHAALRHVGNGGGRSHAAGARAAVRDGVG